MLTVKKKTIKVGNKLQKAPADITRAINNQGEYSWAVMTEVTRFGYEMSEVIKQGGMKGGRRTSKI